MLRFGLTICGRLLAVGLVMSAGAASQTAALGEQQQQANLSGSPHDLRSYSGSWGSFEAGFVPQASHFLLGEPLLIDFVVKNTGPRPLAFRLGGDCRGSVRHNRFLIVARNGLDASPLPDPHGYNHGGGLIDIEQLEPGRTYRQPLVLQHWVALEEPGRMRRAVRQESPPGPEVCPLSVTAAHTLEVVLPKDQLGAAQVWVPIADAFLLTFRKGSDEELRAVVGRLGQQCRSDDPLRRRKAFIALREIQHPAAVAVLCHELLHSGNRGSGNAEQAMWAMEPWLGDPQIPAALEKYLDGYDPQYRAQSTVSSEACRLLAQCKQPEAQAALVRLAEKATGALQMEAVRGLCRVEKGRALPGLHRLLAATKPNDVLRAPIAAALCEHGERFDRQWVMEIIRGWPGVDQTCWEAIGVIEHRGNLSDARALATSLRDDSSRETSAFNQRVIVAIVRLGGPRHPYQWLSEDQLLKDPHRVTRNRQSIEAYREWGRQPGKN